MATQEVANEDVAVPPGAAVGREVDVVTGGSQLADQSPVEGGQVGRAIAEPTKVSCGGYDFTHVVECDLNVDARFGAHAGDRRAPNVLDLDDPPAEQPDEPRSLDL